MSTSPEEALLRTTFHVVPPPPPHRRNWREVGFAVVLAILLNVFVFAPFLLLAPEQNPSADPPAISVDLVQEPPPPEPQPVEEQQEEQPQQQRTLTRSGGPDDIAPGQGTDEEASLAEVPEAAPEVEDELELELKTESELTETTEENPPSDIPEWARTVERSYAVPAPKAKVPAPRSSSGGDPYLNAMWARVQSNMVYPVTAGGRVGVARFELVLHRNGQVSQVTLLTSAGHPDLDRAAFDAIRKSLPFAPLPAEIAGDVIPLVGTIPIQPGR